MEITHALLSQALDEVRPTINEEFYKFMRFNVVNIYAKLSSKSYASGLSVTSSLTQEEVSCAFFDKHYKKQKTVLIIRVSGTNGRAYSELASEEGLNASLIIEALYEASKLYSRVNNLREGK